MIQCRTTVKRDAVSRQSIDGVEHIIVSSSTLPDDIVMNGGLYPAEEIATSFKSLEGTLAPIEHPQINGEYISANDARAIHAFHGGAFNMNVKQENGRVHIDKYINVSEALKTDRGKRLLDRIEELENNENARPIHTSVGVFVDVEELSEPHTNSAGDEFTWVAHDMVFDHDAILLDSVGAAQPHQGVGVAVNAKGEEFKVQSVSADPEDRPAVRVVSNQSFSDIHKSVAEGLERSAIDADFIDELFEDRVIFWSGDQLFEVEYVIDDNDLATIVGLPLPVEREVTFAPKTNKQKGDVMKDMIINALKGRGVETEGLSDDQLFDAYNQLQANQSGSDDKGASDESGDAGLVANALAEIAAKIEGLEAKMNSAADTELNAAAELIGNSDKYPGLDTEAAKKLGLDTLKSMAGNCSQAFGLSPVVNAGSGRDESQCAPTAMPE